MRLTGATVADVAALIKKYHPDLLLMQEATEEVNGLPDIAGGHVLREPLHRRVYGLAAWSPHRLPPSYALPLPVSTMPGRVPPRVAQILRVGELNFANVHLSHGQILNRRQFLYIARSLDGPTAIVGDYNAVGPVKMAGFIDVGPRQPTLAANNIIYFRLDRCMVRGLECSSTRVLERGPSDHHPIMLTLNAAPEGACRPRGPELLGIERVRQGSLNLANIPGWLRAVSQSPDRMRVPHTLGEARKLMKTKRRAKISFHSSNEDGNSALH